MRDMSRSTKVVLVLGALLVLAAATGFLRSDRGIEVSQDQAVDIARVQVDFVPEQTAVRMVRRGFNSTPFWAVSLSIPAPEGQGYQRLTTVLVHAGTGDVVEVNREK